jgi:hypothetical protein
LVLQTREHESSRFDTFSDSTQILSALHEGTITPNFDHPNGLKNCQESEMVQFSPQLKSSGTIKATSFLTRPFALFLLNELRTWNGMT